MKNCRKCNALINDEAHFCPYCGIDSPCESIKRCFKCNAEITEESNYCPRCGAKLSQGEVLQQPALPDPFDFNLSENESASSNQPFATPPYPANRPDSSAPKPFPPSAPNQPYGANQMPPYKDPYWRQTPPPAPTAAVALALGIISLVVSMFYLLTSLYGSLYSLSFSLSFFNFGGVVLGILAIVNGVKGKNKKQKYAVGAIITGIIGICLILCAFLYGCAQLFMNSTNGWLN